MGAVHLCACRFDGKLNVISAMRATALGQQLLIHSDQFKNRTVEKTSRNVASECSGGPLACSRGRRPAARKTRPSELTLTSCLLLVTFSSAGQDARLYGSRKIRSRLFCRDVGERTKRSYRSR